MPPYASLLHPIECPYCQQVSGHEIQFLQGYFPEQANLDLCLGEVLDWPIQAAESGFRTHGISLCLNCQGTVTSLLVIRKRKVVEVEVFPKRVQMLLSTFPDCLYLQNSDDADMVLLSDLLQKHGAKKLCEAIHRLATEHFTEDYWTQRSTRSHKLMEQDPALKKLLNYLHEETPVEQETLFKELDALLAQKAEVKAMTEDHESYEKERDKRHDALKAFLAKTP